MRKLFRRIKLWLNLSIIFPVKAWINFHIFHTYITDNMKSRALMEYCEKVMEDFNYQPQTIYERIFEERLHNIFDRIIESNPAFSKIDLKYEDERPYCAAQIYELMLQKVWVDERL